MDEKNATQQQQPTLQPSQETGNPCRLSFVRSSLFYGAAWVMSAAATAQFIIQQFTGEDYTRWILFVALIMGSILMFIHSKRHPKITPTDRLLMNVWIYAILICLYTGIIQQQWTKLPIMGFLIMGAAIAVGITAEVYRLDTANKSNIGGSLVALVMASIIGAFLASWIFVASSHEAIIGQFIVTLGAIAILLFGTGVVLNHNENRNKA